MVHESADEADDVFPLPTHRLMNATTSLNSSVSGVMGTSANTSFDFRLPPAPPVQVHETTM
jgi:hypothetical protein